MSAARSEHRMIGNSTPLSKQPQSLKKRQSASITSPLTATTSVGTPSMSQVYTRHSYTKTYQHHPVLDTPLTSQVTPQLQQNNLSSSSITFKHLTSLQLPNNSTASYENTPQSMSHRQFDISSNTNSNNNNNTIISSLQVSTLFPSSQSTQRSSRLINFSSSSQAFPSSENASAKAVQTKQGHSFSVSNKNSALTVQSPQQQLTKIGSSLPRISARIEGNPSLSTLKPPQNFTSSTQSSMMIESYDDLSTRIVEQPDESLSSTATLLVASKYKVRSSVNIRQKNLLNDFPSQLLGELEASTRVKTANIIFAPQEQSNTQNRRILAADFFPSQQNYSKKIIGSSSTSTFFNNNKTNNFEQQQQKEPIDVIQQLQERIISPNVTQTPQQKNTSIICDQQSLNPSQLLSTTTSRLSMKSIQQTQMNVQSLNEQKPIKQIVQKKELSEEREDDDKRRFKELFELSPLPKSRRQTNIDSDNTNPIQERKLITLNVCQTDQFLLTTNKQKLKDNQQTNKENTYEYQIEPSHESANKSHRKLTTFKATAAATSSTTNRDIPPKENSTTDQLLSMTTATSRSKAFSRDYKKISHILDEARHFNDPIRVGEAMLKAAVSKNVLPRKLGIITNVTQNQKNITDVMKAIKSKARLNSMNETSSRLFSIHASPRPTERNQLQYGTQFNNNINNDFNNNLRPNSSPKRLESNNMSQLIDSSFTSAFGVGSGAAGCNSSNQITTLSKRISEFMGDDIEGTPLRSTIAKSSLQFSRATTGTQLISATTATTTNSMKKMKSQPTTPATKLQVDRHTNGIADSENRRDFFHLSFVDSQEIATYLSKNCLLEERMLDFEENNLDQQTSNSETRLNLNLSRLQISKRYSEMLANALQHDDFERLNSLNLTDNNLAGAAILQLSQSFPKHVRHIDLTSNFLTGSDAKAISNLFNSKKYESLISLNLSNNNLADTGLKAIADSIIKNTQLLTLNLRDNRISDISAPTLRKLLTENTAIQELYFGWNLISSKGAIEFAIGLANNFNIKVLDLSHNCLGQNPSLRSGSKIIESCNKIESGVVHLDLSYNLFSQQECLQIADSLKKNQKIYGFHFEGNESHAIVDSRGFLFFPGEDQILSKHVSTHTLMRKDIRSVKCLGVNKLQNFNCNATDNCWICDGWQEVEFSVSEGCSDFFMGEPAFLHLDFEDFKPMYMDKDPTTPGRFVLRRMCPPNRRILFFFTNPCSKILFESSDFARAPFHVNEQNIAFYEDEESELLHEKHQQQKHPNNNNNNHAFAPSAAGDNSLDNEISIMTSAHHLQHSKQRKFTVKYFDGTFMEYIVPTTVNCITTRLHRNILKRKGDYDVQVTCVPRPEETFYKINYTNQWHRAISLFKSYQADTPEIEEKCFLEDWNSSKISTILVGQDKSIDLNECKKLLLDRFPQLRVIYRYLSCYGLANDVFCVTYPPFALFAQQSTIVDGKLLRMRDIQCLFISASSKALKARNPRAPDKSLTRSEFLELIVRIALDKYMRNKIAKTPAEAFTLFLSNPTFLKHIAEYEEPQQWRDVRYWTKQCDEMMKRYLNFVKTIWNEYAESSTRLDKRAFGQSMNLEEFCSLVSEFEIKDKLDLSDREIILSFNLALISTPDELKSDRYMVLSFVEFLEALARLAEFKSIVPVGERHEAYQPGERLQVRLEYKIESLLESMSTNYATVMKARKKRALAATATAAATLVSATTTAANQVQKSSLVVRQNSKLAALKTRKSFVQFSLQEIDESADKGDATPTDLPTEQSYSNARNLSQLNLTAIEQRDMSSYTMNFGRNASLQMDYMESLNEVVNGEDDDAADLQCNESPLPIRKHQSQYSNSSKPFSLNEIGED